MYLEYYGLREPPFSITPDPRYVFLSERHRDALAHLLYGIGKGGSGGFVQLTGEVGTGKTALRDGLARAELRQLAQRITARYHLTPLDAGETEAYVRHRLAVAGSPRVPFSRLGLKALYQRSGGIPRLINIIADRALMAGFAREQDSIGERIVDRAADEALPGHARYWVRRYGRLAAAAALVLAVAGAFIAWRAPHTAAPAAQLPPAEPKTPEPSP